ncbi:hypothetical protein ACLMAJ_16730 [Nocardia sp. KC 131]|uniref:hypothetical protein n=1 Tax=Nocardia arseniciresistens TaxID=3392119 RepID=UPI00398EFAE0
MASRARRWTVWILAIIFVLFVFPGCLGAVATAASSAGSSTNSALSWMDVKDSSGVQLSNYMFATDRGGLLNPGNTALSLVISLEFAGWIVIVTTGIWLIGYALSFKWLDMFGSALSGVADSLTGQIATPIMLVTAVTIGAFFVGWFIVRGFHSKAAIQVVTMIGVAIIGPVFLAAPLAEVLSSDGWLAQGRDVGLSVAAGLNGNSHPDPTQLIESMQKDMADNFARRPLQIWNFGHIVDDQPGCRSAWTTGIASGDEDRVKDGMDNCNDDYAKWQADHPSVGQIGAGLVLLLSGAVLLMFAVYLAIKIIWAALDAIYHGFMSIFGFAAGGFVYGPTQTFLVRNLVDGLIAAARMAIYSIFLGIYVLFLASLFRQAGGQVMSVFVIGAIVEIVAVLQLQRLSHGLSSGNQWIANRFSLAIQGAGGGGGGGGGGNALGMAASKAGGSMPGGRALTAMAALNTIGGSHMTEWLWGRTRQPLKPFSRLEKRAQVPQWRVAAQPWFAESNSQAMMKQLQFSRIARLSAERYGGVNTVRGAAAALDGLMVAGGGIDSAWGALSGAGFTDERLMTNAIRSRGIMMQNSEDETLANKQLGQVVSALQHAQRSSNDVARGRGNINEAAADLATLQESAFRLRRANPGGVTLDGGAAAGPQQRFVADYMNAPTAAKLQQLQRLSAGDLNHATGTLHGVDQIGAGRMMQWIGNEHALQTQRAVDRLIANPTDVQLMRQVRGVVANAADTDQWASGVNRTPWNSVAFPGTNPPPGNWGPAMAPVAELLR